MTDRCYVAICFPADALRIKAIEDLTKDLFYSDRDINDGLAWFSDPEARGGRLDELEASLVAHDIPFDRYSDGYADVDPEARQFRPARYGKPAVDVTYACALSRYEPIVFVADVKKALREKTAEEYLAELEKEYPEVEPLVWTS